MKTIFISLTIITICNSMFSQNELKSLEEIMREINSNNFSINLNDSVSNHFENEGLSFPMLKIKQFGNFEVYYILEFENMDKDVDIEISTGFKLLLFSKIENCGLIISYNRSHSIKKIQENQFELAFMASQENFIPFVIITNEENEKTGGMELNWMNRDLPRDMEPHTNIKLNCEDSNKVINITLKENFYLIPIKRLFDIINQHC